MKIKRLVSILLCVMMIAMGASAALAEDTVKIGHIAPMTGGLAAYGTAVNNAIELAISEINANGGLLGKQVELITKDNQADPAETVSAFNALLGEDVAAIIGAIRSACTSAITGLANDEGIVLITATSTADAITEEDNYVFRSCYKDSFQGAMCAAFAAAQGWTKVGILYTVGDAYSSGLRDSFLAAAAELGLTVVEEQSTSDISAVDFSSQLATIASAGVDVLFAPYYYNTIGPNIIPQAREAGYTGPILGADGFDGTESVAVGDLKAYENVYFTNHYSPEDPSPAVQDFIAAYTAVYPPESLNALAALAYDAMKMLAVAIEKAGTTDHDAIREAMVGMHYVGVTGDMTLDETGTPAKSVSIITYVVDGDKLVQKFVTTAQ
ncbi:MAG TPA: ABC transporter substrate-binding protein [Candidatus Limiplasma sp.]|nr:ABC transporter substrate-binding protein [Candidatus Limiplasma sp.]